MKTASIATDSNAEGDLDQVAAAVLTASRVLVGVAARSLAGMAEEITVPQYRALIVLAGHGAMRPVDLADALSITSSTATRLCDRLVLKGLISRERTGPDRRAVELALTSEGRHLLDTVTVARQSEIVRILEAVPESERLGIARALALFGQAAGEVPDQQWRTGWEL